MKKQISSIIQANGRVAALAVLALGIMGLVFLAACDGGGGSEGGATIRGTVASFQGQTSYFAPDRGSFLLARAMSDLLELVVPSARAAVAGVIVSVAGTDLFSTTGPDGFFVISAVPPGRQQLVFTLGADSGVLDLDVPDHSEIDLGDVRVSDGEAHPSKVEVTIDDDEGADDEHSGDGDLGDDASPGGGEPGDDSGSNGKNPDGPGHGGEDDDPPPD